MQVSFPGSLRCPLCLSNDNCENAPEQVCPAGSTHCYDGVLRLRGEGIRANLKVQGCMTQPGCNLLNGIKAIGTLHMSESCGLQLGPKALDCNRASFDTVRNVSALHLSWTTGWETCEPGEGCYEIVMLLQNGHEFHMVLTKGCTRDVNKKAQFTKHRTGPGISIVSYFHVCRDRDFCNDLSTTETLWIPPPDTGCRGPCAAHTAFQPAAVRTHQNRPALQAHTATMESSGSGEGTIATNLRVQGCSQQPGCDLLSGVKAIGPVDVREDCGSHSATTNMSGTRHCPTCVALGSCSSAPSMPCANSTTQCYQGRLEFSGGGMDSTLQVKGCTTMVGCRLMAMIVSVGPMTVKETCSYQSLLQPRVAETGASWMPTSMWVLELLLPALLLPLILCP
ncbi:CD177 antigen [Apodemus speciosus]|uniref:CD177 antigen n=1 Tax=Apodemus speciosus TaxID=105296 RepID=A0ABQ0EXV9_APOSI